MENVVVNNVEYVYKETFDVNLTMDYENSRWDTWHIVREFISNALDGVGGDANRVSINEEGGFFNVSDDGQGYSIVYAKRIGASSKRDEADSIGQFGEGTKMALLTCIRKGITVRLASQNWFIIPRISNVEEGVQVLVFDIYESNEYIHGSFIGIQATEEVRSLINNKDVYFLQFNSQKPLFGDIRGGIYPKGQQARVFNKGVYIKDVDALYTYALSIGELNRDRDLVDDDTLCMEIRDIWNTVNDPILMKTYLVESERAGNQNTNSKCKEFEYCIYPEPSNIKLWLKSFNEAFGDKAVLYTNDLAAREALHLGYTPVKFEYFGRQLAENISIIKDVDVCRHDYEFTWVSSLSRQEEKRLEFFRKIAERLELPCPETVKIFEAYAKSEYMVGMYEPNRDEIYLKRERFRGDMLMALETFLHELTHRSTKAGDGERAFADGLSMLAAKAIMEIINNVGYSVTLKLTNRGFQLPLDFRYSADNIKSYIATMGSEIIIATAGRKLKASVPWIQLRPYCSEREVTFYKGRFYINVPVSIRSILPEEVAFYVTGEEAQIN